MDRERVDDFLSTADAVLDDDWTVGPDAMRWTPEGQRTEEAREPRRATGVTCTFDISAVLTGMSRIREAFAGEVRPALARMAEAATRAGESLVGVRVRFGDRLSPVTSGEVFRFDADPDATCGLAAWQIDDTHDEPPLQRLAGLSGLEATLLRDLEAHSVAQFYRDALASRRSPRPADDITDPRERALHLRRTRNTGPQQNRRAPRRIDPRRGRT